MGEHDERKCAMASQIPKSMRVVTMLILNYW
jgi:hypothetical protein